MIQLPPDGQATQEAVWDYTTDLDGETYRIVLAYRERQDSWYLDLYDASDVLLIGGKRLSVNWPILRGHPKAGMPPGQLVLIDTSGAGTNAGYEDLGRSHLLYYVEDGDVSPASSSSGITISIGTP